MIGWDMVESLSILIPTYPTSLASARPPPWTQRRQNVRLRCRRCCAAEILRCETDVRNGMMGRWDDGMMGCSQFIIVHHSSSQFMTCEFANRHATFGHIDNSYNYLGGWDGIMDWISCLRNQQWESRRMNELSEFTESTNRLGCWIFLVQLGWLFVEGHMDQSAKKNVQPLRTDI